MISIFILSQFKKFETDRHITFSCFYIYHYFVTDRGKKLTTINGIPQSSQPCSIASQTAP